MKIHNYITAKDWNSLTFDEIDQLVKSLRFDGHQVDNAYIPHYMSEDAVMLDSYGDLCAYPKKWLTEEHSRITLEELRKYMSLRTFAES